MLSKGFDALSNESDAALRGGAGDGENEGRVVEYGSVGRVNGGEELPEGGDGGGSGEE